MLKEPLNSNIDYWASAILLERQHDPLLVLTRTIEKYPLPKNAVGLILGDACKINSKFLIEEKEFKLVDNVDQSSLINDDFFKSPKLINHQMLFGGYEYSKEKYDFVFAKSITFASKELLPDIITSLASSLKSNGILLSVWILEQDSIAPDFGKFTQKDVELLFDKQQLTLLESNIVGPRQGKNLANSNGTEHWMYMVHKKI